MNYKTQKFLVLTGLYLTICFAVSAAVGDLGQGFVLATVGLMVAYALAVEAQKR